MITKLALVIIVCFFDWNYFTSLMLSKHFTHWACWFLASKTEDIQSLVFMLIANWNVLSWWRCWLTGRLVNWFFGFFWFCQLSRIHVDNVFNEQISRETMDSMTIDHDLETTCWALELTTWEANCIRGLLDFILKILIRTVTYSLNNL